MMPVIKTQINIDSDYFKPITLEEYNDMLTKYWYGTGYSSMYTQKEFDTINNRYLSVFSIPNRYLNLHGRLSSSIHLQVFNKPNIIDVYKCNDEWYYVNSYINTVVGEKYKCDQFEGLLECLDYLQSKVYQSI